MVGDAFFLVDFPHMKAHVASHHSPVVAQGALPGLRLGVDLLVLVEGVQRVAHLAAERALLLRLVALVDHGAVLPQPLLVGKGLAALRQYWALDNV